MYYTIVLIIAIVVLIAALSVVGVAMTSGANKKDFPEFENTCPDYWTLTETKNKPLCYPPKNGINTPNPANFAGKSPVIAHAGVSTANNAVSSLDLSSPNWMSVCDKSAWASANGIVWDGVTNNNSC